MSLGRGLLLGVAVGPALVACGGIAIIDPGPGVGGQGGGGAAGSGAASTGTSGGSTGGTASVCTPGVEVLCYDGPTQTAGVGACQLGTMTCQADGAAYGPCLGQVVPAAEICQGSLDDDCDGWVNEDCGAAAKDAAGFGGSSNDLGWTLAFDAAGNLFLGGEFSSPELTLGGETLQKTGAAGGWIAKLDASLAPLWLRGISGPGGQQVLTMATDAIGRVVFAGVSAGAVDLGGGMIPAAPDLNAFVALYDGAGQYQWGHVLAGAGDARAHGVTVLPDGDVVVVGVFHGTLSMTGTDDLTSAGSQDGFAVRFGGASGKPIWAKRYGTAGQEQLSSVAAAPNGDLLLAGIIPTDGDLDFGGGGVTVGKLTLALARLTGGGDHVWSKGFAGVRLFAVDIASGPDGDVYLAGGLDHSSDFGGGLLQADDDIFVARLDPAGQHVFSRSFGNPTAMQKANALAVDAVGNVIVVGRVHGGLAGTVDLGGGPVSVDEGMFVAKYTPSGDHQWSSIFPKNLLDAYDVAVNAAGFSAITGRYQGSFDVGTGPLPIAGAEDVLVAIFAP